MGAALARLNEVSSQPLPSCLDPPFPALPAPGRVQLVVVSPLMRALETAAGAFGVPPNSSGGAEAALLLMCAQSGEPSLRTQHGAVAPRPGVAFIANELCRERLGEPKAGPPSIPAERWTSAATLPAQPFAPCRQ